MQVSKLEDLAARLHRLCDDVRSGTLDRHAPLDESSALVAAARECEFMLPQPLTVASLTDTVNHKIEIVNMLLRRAREHAGLPASARTAAEHEYIVTEDDYLAGTQEQTQQEASIRR
jgi:hypothetical protein